MHQLGLKKKPHKKPDVMRVYHYNLCLMYKAVNCSHCVQLMKGITKGIQAFGKLSWGFTCYLDAGKRAELHKVGSYSTSK